ncbi:MAG: hypothetical protein ACLURV_08530 [Gallintestinimicrobium sp.]
MRSRRIAPTFHFPFSRVSCSYVPTESAIRLTLKQIREAMELPVQDCCSALETAIRKAALPTQDNYTAIVLHYYGEKENTE